MHTAAKLVGLCCATAALCGSPARAQTTYTTAQLQALATTDAQQYGVPVNLFLAQIQGESSFNPNIGTSTAGAEGIAQFKPATAASLGIDPLDPAQALQGAAEYDAQLYQQNGNSWVGALSSYSGGLTPANPGNPNYATAFADAQTADAGGTATASAGDYGLSVATTDGPSTTTATAAAPTQGGGTTPASSTGAGGALSQHPFEWMQSTIFSAFLGEVQTVLTQVDNIAYTPLTTLLVIAVAVSGVGLLFRQLTIDTFMVRVIRWAFLITILTPGAAELQNYVVQPIEQLPTYFASAFAGSLTTNGSSANAATVLDAVFDTSLTTAQHVWSESGWAPSRLFFSGLMIALILIVTAVALLVIYIAVAIITMASLIMICIFPVVALALLFESTMKFLRGYVDIVAGLLLTLLAVDIVLALYMQVLVQVENAAQPSTATVANYSDLCGFFAQCLVIVTLALTTRYIPRVLERLSGAAAVGIDHVAAYIAGAPAAAAGAAASASRATAGVVAGIRATSPPSRSLSRG
jgi:TrbL/VirB6 plasmid conjugal transfer protein/Transglycosylase SLT domain